MDSANFTGARPGGAERSTGETRNDSHGRIAGLDGLRAVAVLLVVLSHYGFNREVPGALGVTIFFFLSGYLITTLLLRETARTGTVKKRDFYIRRFLRLSPELAFLLLFSGLGGALYVGLPRVMDFVAAAFYFTNYYHVAHIYGQVEGLRWPHLWSLAVEEHYYILYPLVFSLFWRTPKRFTVFLIGVCVAALAWRCVAIKIGLPGGYTYVASEARIDSIAYGCLLALLSRREAWRDFWAKHWIAAQVIGVALLVSSLLIRDPFFRDTFRYSMQGLGLAFAFAGLLQVRPGNVGLKLLEVAPLVWMGQMSYGAYLWHLEFAHLSERFLPGVFHEEGPLAMRALYALLATSFAFGAGYVSYRLVGEPMLALRKRFGAHVEPAPKHAAKG
ncbi:acyltransferase [Caulobacter segnis]|uniref:Acyltransferase n=1 Tax=Caulobacter segnis TaxID=88688 RepID=A0A2W5UX52_9CAUL|nr:acyltransferase [Caulobacter segnis]PZR32250.1 MAG: acyltransferase [Caulobacter segnis]